MLSSYSLAQSLRSKAYMRNLPSSLSQPPAYQYTCIYINTNSHSVCNDCMSSIPTSAALIQMNCQKYEVFWPGLALCTCKKIQKLFWLHTLHSYLMKCGEAESNFSISWHKESRKMAPTVTFFFLPLTVFFLFVLLLTDILFIWDLWLHIRNNNKWNLMFLYLGFNGYHSSFYSHCNTCSFDPKNYILWYFQLAFPAVNSSFLVYSTSLLPYSG